jgi:hypothetical protein
MSSTALVRQVDEAASPLPVFNAAQMTQALGAYKQLQRSLDEAMPDAIMSLDGKQFRKKSYWRAVAVAFNLTVEPVTPERDERTVVGLLEDGAENYVYTVTYRAATPGGRSAIGDGACSAAEKAKGRMRASEHNVRSHAHTRAFNRAVSNLVGFGEVSAEEVEHEERAPGPSGSGGGGGGAATASYTVAPGSYIVTAGGGGGGGAPSPGVTHVKDVAVKTGKSKKGDWTLGRVTFTDGRVGSTFDKKIMTACQDAQASGAPVNPLLEMGEKGWNLNGLLPRLAQEQEPKPDEPVTGPEKVLTARKITRQDGTVYVVIQTDKRQLYTAAQPVWEEAVAARKAGLGIVPRFEVGPWVGVDRPVNRLLSFDVETAAPVPEIDLAAEAEEAVREPGDDD